MCAGQNLGVLLQLPSKWRMTKQTVVGHEVYLTGTTVQGV